MHHANPMAVRLPLSWKWLPGFMCSSVSTPWPANKSRYRFMQSFTVAMMAVLEWCSRLPRLRYT